MTVKLIRKILWLALSKTAFPLQAFLLDDKEKISLEQCRDAGMLSLEASVASENEVVAIPVMALVVMEPNRANIAVFNPVGESLWRGLGDVGAGGNGLFDGPASRRCGRCSS